MCINTGRIQGKKVILALLMAYPLLLMGLSALHVFAPQPSGPLALTQVFAPYLFAPLLLLVPVAFWSGMSILRRAMLVSILIFGLRFLPTVLSPPPLQTPDALSISVMTWNVYRYNTHLSDIRQVFTAPPASIVALQELSPQQAEAIITTPGVLQHYPYRILRPQQGVLGMGLLSTYPILEQGTLDKPPILWARLKLGSGRTLVVVNAHPVLGHMAKLRSFSILYRYDPAHRDLQIRRLREVITPFLQRGEPLLLVGDFNVTDREPAYQALTAGLHDAHDQAGWGWGHSWRPSPAWSFGVIRIDHLLSTTSVTPLRTSTDCTPRGSDHCIVQGVFELQ